MVLLRGTDKGRVVLLRGADKGRVGLLSRLTRAGWFY